MELSEEASCKKIGPTTVKFKPLIPIFIFFLGAAVILFLLGLKSRIKPEVITPTTLKSTSTTLITQSNTKDSLSLKKDQTIPKTSQQLDKNFLCPEISQGLQRSSLDQILRKNNIAQSSLLIIRKNIHINTKDGKKLRLVFKNKALELSKSELTLMVLESKKNATFIKHPVPKELKFSPKIEKVLEYYKSDQIIYEDQVNIYQDDQKEIIFETIQGKIVNFNMSHIQKNKSFNCVSASR